MSFLLKIQSKTRLKFGVLALLLGVASFVIMHYYNIGFLGGFISGLLLALGIGLIVTHKETNSN